MRQPNRFGDACRSPAHQAVVCTGGRCSGGDVAPSAAIARRRRVLTDGAWAACPRAARLRLARIPAAQHCASRIKRRFDVQQNARQRTVEADGLAVAIAVSKAQAWPRAAISTTRTHRAVEKARAVPSGAAVGRRPAVRGPRALCVDVCPGGRGSIRARRQGEHQSRARRAAANQRGAPAVVT